MIPTSVRLYVKQRQLVTGSGILVVVLPVTKGLQNGGFLENRDAHDLQNSVEALVEVETLLDDGDQHVDGYGNPDLRLHGVRRGAIERLDPKMLLDPFEKQLHVPSGLVEQRDRQGVLVQAELGARPVGLSN